MKRRGKQAAKRVSDKGFEQLYEPEKILESRKNKDGEFFLVKWKGYSEEESTWEQKKNIGHCDFLFTNFEAAKHAEKKEELKNLDRIIDKKFIKSRVYYLVKWRGRRSDEWLSRADILAFHPEKITEYESQYGLVHKRRQKEKEFDHENRRYEDSDDDDDNTSESNSDDSSSDTSKSNSNSRSNSRSNSQSPPSRDSQEEKTFQSKGNNTSDLLSTRRVVKAVKKSSQKKEVVEYGKLPSHGIFGIDEPNRLQNMVIDKAVGHQNDGYFACDIAWKNRPNDWRPFDSRVSRLDVKMFYPLLLIAFYEENMTYNGEVENNQEPSDEEEEEEEDDNDDDNQSYKKRTNNNNNVSRGGRRRTSTDDAFGEVESIPVGYAKAMIDQKKSVKWDEFLKNAAMEELN